jgi:hypothetical protein
VQLDLEWAGVCVCVRMQMQNNANV